VQRELGAARWCVKWKRKEILIWEEHDALSFPLDGIVIARTSATTTGNHDFWWPPACGRYVKKEENT
jgi:hypothetical protein